MPYFSLAGLVHLTGHLELQVSDLNVHTERWVQRTDGQLKPVV